MSDICPLWVAAHGIMIVTPVSGYQETSPIKLMMDRLVCADGGNPDPTLIDGKDAALAKSVELAGWDYLRRLAGRTFSVVVHGDVAAVQNVRRSLSDWLKFMKLGPASRSTAISVIRNPTPPATQKSKRILTSRTRCAMPPGFWPRQWFQCGPAIC